MANLKAVRAWAVRCSDGLLMAIEGDFFKGRATPKVREDFRSEPVVIVPAAEYRAMRAAVRKMKQLTRKESK